jgi:four helix bundle protein
MRTARSYRDLGVWRKAIALSVSCYQVTGGFPREEAYGMTAQIRRASVSIAANIAEGHGCEHTKTFMQFLRVSQGSLKELETHLVIAHEVGLLQADHVQPLFTATEELGRMLRGLLRSLEKRVANRE